jgi:protein gp37
MGDRTKISWTDATWNPMSGCTPVSPACDHCYAKTMATRLQKMGSQGYKDGFAITLKPDLLEVPLHWKRPRKVFVCSMGDLFHETVPDEFISHVLHITREAYRHTFQILTKRLQAHEPRLGTGNPGSMLSPSRSVLHEADE